MTTGITWHSVGTLEYGTSEHPLPLPDDYGMAGYSLAGRRAPWGGQTLYARSLALKDASGEEAGVHRGPHARRSRSSRPWWPRAASPPSA
ncbi:MAG: hypothetical protein IPI43_11370 [Sandaracinaceae bacterium]|nr:hypothetical protein [Sandaracinaceae bacterium]